MTLCLAQLHVAREVFREAFTGLCFYSSEIDPHWPHDPASDMSLGGRVTKGQVMLQDRGSSRKDNLAAAAYIVCYVHILPSDPLTLQVFCHLPVAAIAKLGSGNKEAGVQMGKTAWQLQILSMTRFAL